MKDLPWPFSPREMVLKCHLLLLPNKGGALGFAKSMNEKNYFGYEVEEAGEEIVRIEMKRGYHFLKYIDPTHTLSRATFKIDPKMDMIPDWLINQLMKARCQGEMSKVRERCQEIIEK